MKPLLVGEDNPHSGDPYFALWPDPPGCAGHRLCYTVLGLSVREYLDRFERMNLCDGPWCTPDARAAAVQIHENPSFLMRPVILLGAKVAQAFTLQYTPFEYLKLAPEGPDYYMLPHPSGRARAWNDPGAVGRARDLLKEFLR